MACCSAAVESSGWNPHHEAWATSLLPLSTSSMACGLGSPAVVRPATIKASIQIARRRMKRRDRMDMVQFLSLRSGDRGRFVRRDGLFRPSRRFRCATGNRLPALALTRRLRPDYGRRPLPVRRIENALVIRIDLERPGFHLDFDAVFFRGLRWYSHEYRQVKPQPYSNVPRSTTLPSGSVMVNAGFSGRPPFTIRLLQTSPPMPTSDIPNEILSPD